MARHTSSTLKELQRISLDNTDRHQARQQQPTIPTAPPGNKAIKCGYALYPPDLARIDAIRDYIQHASGHRITSSQAVRLALRSVALDPAMVTVLDAMRSEDGRGKWQS